MKSKTTITTETWKTTLIKRIETESDQQELAPIPPKVRAGLTITGPHFDSEDEGIKKELERREDE